MLKQQRTTKNAPQPQPPTTTPSKLAGLPTAQPQIVCLRDGEVVLYRRSRSLMHQCRYKLADGTW